VPADQKATPPLPPGTRALVELALAEDLGTGDVTSESIFDGETMTAKVVAREPLVIAGHAAASAVFAELGVGYAVEREDGSHVSPGESVATVDGVVSAVLAGERTALNFLQRLSGVASAAAAFVKAVTGTSARVVDTRKTTPGYRWLEKSAVRAGGMHNHRADLSSGVLIKDNHIAAVGSVTEAVSRVKARAPHSLRIEVEVDTIEQMREAIEAGAEIVLLDNMSADNVKSATAEAHERGVLVEVSGGITLSTVRSYAEAGADFISTGSVTHSARAMDLGLDVP